MSSHLGKTRTNRGFLPRFLCVFLDSARIHCSFSFNLWLVYRMKLKAFCVTPVFPCYVLFCLFQSNLSLLRIRYLLREAVDEVTVGDNEPVRIRNNVRYPAILT